MKELNKIADKERKDILKDDTFLEENLYPLVANKKPKANFKKLSLILSPLVVIIVSLAVFLPMCIGGYSSGSETKISNINYLNESLKKTQINCELQSVILTYKSKSGKPIFFTVSNEKATEEILINCEFIIIVDKKYNPDISVTEYKDSFKILNYDVLFNQSIMQNDYEGMLVYEYTIKAFMDTQEERYYFNYSEVSANESSSFLTYLEKLIINKI